MNFIKLLLLACVLCVSRVASADPLSYTYVDAAYTRESAYDADAGHGYALSGSYDIAAGFFVSADYAHGVYHEGFVCSFGCGPVDVTQNRRSVSGAWRLALSDSADWVVRLGYVRQSTDIGGSPFLASFYNRSSSGYDLSTGFRAALTPKLELDAFLDHDSAGFGVKLPFSSGYAENLLTLGARWHFTPRFSLGLAIEDGNHHDKHRALLSARWSF